MRLDKFANPIFNQTDLFNALYAGHLPPLSDVITEDSEEITNFSNISGIDFKKINPDLSLLSIEQFDKQMQEHWFMPDEYYTFDIQEFCISKCASIEEQTRVIDELTEYTKRDMIKLLQWLKYFVDTCIKEQIVWGVGRGSSVASFVLYLIGVHKIDSIKYNLDWKDFLR